MKFAVEMVTLGGMIYIHIYQVTAWKFCACLQVTVNKHGGGANLEPFSEGRMIMCSNLLRKSDEVRAD
jgi:uncharacterized protein (DUF779 family)